MISRVFAAIVAGVPLHGSANHLPTGVTPGPYTSPMTLQINEQGHIEAAYKTWQNDIEYANNDLTVGSDSFIYISQLPANVGNDPIADDGTNWKLWGWEFLLLDGSRQMEGNLLMGGHKIVNLGTPTGAADAATKLYVDNAVSGVGGGVTAWKTPVKVATTAALAANTRTSNDLDANANGALAAIDGVSLSVNDRVLVKDEATGANNGIYFVASLGSAGTKWKLTRATDADASAEVVTGIAMIVQQGTVNASRQYILTTTGTITLNTTALTFTQFGQGSGVPAGSSSGDTLRWNGSNWAASSVLANDGTNVSVITTGGSPAFKVQNSAGGVIWGLSTAALGASSGAGLSLATTLTPNAADQRIGAINFGSTGSGSLLNGGFISVYTAESWATNRGTYMDFSSVTPGTTITRRVVRIHGYGDVFLQASGTELSTGATRGFTHLPTCNGTPSGAPDNTLTGAAPFIFDRANNKLYAYNSGWQSLTGLGEAAGGKLVRNFTAVNTTYTVQASDYCLVCDAATTYNVTLPLASDQEGRYLIIKRTAESGQLGAVTILRNTGDTIETLAATGQTSIALSAGQCIHLVSDGVSEWHVVSNA